uniref:Spen paralogue and orthologue SPOC C-terminal domain-containing protein n=1 Tax=Globisporangium ultimum (strain ATCC 200006 / CBS 805.95 / DAOM BR144) TaxID=431595 RepID=K3X927_GLOUD
MVSEPERVGVRFRVQKGSSFDFECSSYSAWLNPKLRNLFTRIDELEALQIEHVVISKRLELGDVDRMVAHCRQHPPQCVVCPSTVEHTNAFQEFAAYLKQRQRAGVATLANGYLLLLTPIPGWDNYLRCFAIKSKTNEMDTDSVPPFSLMHLEEDAAATHKDEGSHPSMPPQQSDDAASQV